MTTTIGTCTLIAVAAVVIVLSLVTPSFIGDQNGFLKSFVSHEFLNLLGVVLAITLASSGQLHLQLRNMESRLQRPDCLSNSRSKIRSAAYWLIALFLCGFLIVLVKPAAASSETLTALINGSAILVMVWTILILISLTEAAFAISEPESPK